MKKILIWVLFVTGSLNVCEAGDFDHQHRLFSAVLSRHVVISSDGLTSKVDYRALKKEHPVLTEYLKELSSVVQVEFDKWEKNQQLAFLINAYNAFTLKLVLDYYPVSSIKKIRSGFSGPWRIKFIDMFQRKVSLDYIEHQLIRKKGVYDEPRIHFAIVCASDGCPPLRNHAYASDQLDIQLNDNLERFLQDRSKNRFNEQKNRLEVSKIFKWFKEDFLIGHKSLQHFLADYAHLFSDQPVAQRKIKKGNPGISFTEYGWHLNGIE